MPTSSAMNFSNSRVEPLMNPEDAFASRIPVAIKVSTTLAAGTVVGEITASPGTYAAYASGNVDGTQNPAGILERAVQTDSSGNILNTSEWGTTAKVVTIFTQGIFNTADLTGLDANAVSKLGGHLLQGSVSSGIVSF